LVFGFYGIFLFFWFLWDFLFFFGFYKDTIMTKGRWATPPPTLYNTLRCRETCWWKSRV